MPAIVRILRHLSHEGRPSALLRMRTRLLYLFPLMSGAVHAYLMTIACLDDPHLLLAVVAFIWHHTRDLEAHHRPKVLHVLVLIE